MLSSSSAADECDWEVAVTPQFWMTFLDPSQHLDYSWGFRIQAMDS